MIQIFVRHYKDACEILGKKGNFNDSWKEQLETIIAALNYIDNNNKLWKPKNGDIIYVVCNGPHRFEFKTEKSAEYFKSRDDWRLIFTTG